MTQNPLQGYFRQTKIAVKLPSEGKFYPEGFIEFNVGDELDVKAMTAKDELELKNPDALLNGAAMANLLKSCVPGLKGKADGLLVPDVSVLMLAIRFATYGDNIEFKSECPNCQTDNEFSRSIREALDNIQILDDEYTITLSNRLVLYICPHTFKTSNKGARAEFEQSKIMQIVEREDMGDEEKLNQFGHVFKKMVNLNYELVADSIAKIVTPDNEEYTDKKVIDELLRELSTKEVDIIRDKIKVVNETGLSTTHECKCSNCNHQWKTEGIEFDPSRFFE